MAPAAGSDSVQEVLQQLLLARATTLARAGNYQAAEEVLTAGTSQSDSAAGLDLLARMRAQQGRFGEAEALWQRATQLEPANPACAAGLRLAHRMHGLRPWLYGVSRILLGAVLLLGATLILIAVFGKQVPAPEGQVRNQSQSAADTAPAIASPAPPAIALEDPAVEVRKEDGELVVTFRSGLFSRGARLTPEGRETLDRVARQLEPHGGTLLLRVVGHADDRQPSPGYRYRDNVGLGFERARAAAERLRAAAKLPREAVVLESQGEENPPFSNETRESRARNRTVVLRLAWRRR